MAKDMIGKELPGDDLTNDFDPLSHPAAEMDMGELEKLVDRELEAGTQDIAQEPSTLEEFESQAPPDQQTVQPEQPDEFDDKKAEPEQEVRESQAQEQTEQSEEPTETEEESEPSMEDRLAAIERANEIACLQREKDFAEIEKLTLQRDAQAGKLGAVLQQLNEQARPQARPESDLDYDTAADVTERSTAPVHSTPPEVREELAEIRSERQNRAVETEAMAATQQFQDFCKTIASDYGDKDGQTLVAALNKDLTELVQAGAPEIKEAMEVSNPRTTQRVARNVLRSAWADARIRHLERLDALGRQRSSESVKDLREQKKRARVTGSKGGQKAAKPKEIDPFTAPLDELEKHLDDQFGVNRGAGAEII